MDIDIFIPYIRAEDFKNPFFVLFTLLAAVIVMLCLTNKTKHWLLHRKTAAFVLAIYVCTFVLGLVLPRMITAAVLLLSIATYIWHEHRTRSPHTTIAKT